MMNSAKPRVETDTGKTDKDQAGQTPEFKAIALPALAAATRRNPRARVARRVGVVLDPARYTD